MNSGLLNIWREAGSYLRYADAKCVFFSGVSLSLLISFVKFTVISNDASWALLGGLAYSDIGARSWIAIILFGLAFAFSTLAILPSLSKGLPRVRLLIVVGEFFTSHKGKECATGVIFFRDIAAFPDSTQYEAKVNLAMGMKTPFNPAESDLCEQIWLVSRIATAKFFAVNTSIVALLVGLIFALW